MWFLTCTAYTKVESLSGFRQYKHRGYPGDSFNSFMKSYGSMPSSCTNDGQEADIYYMNI